MEGLLFCSFYVDTGRTIVVIMFQALRNRARKAKAARKPNLSDIKPGSVIENIAQTKRLAETTLGPTPVAPSSVMEEERPTNTGSGSQVTTCGFLARRPSAWFLKGCCSE
jgi:hypothetical protein